MKILNKTCTNFCFLIIFFSVHLSAQTLIDSLKQQLLRQNGKERITTLITLSNQNLFSDAVQAKMYAEEALSLALQFDYKPGIAQSYYHLGFSNYRLGNYPEALDYLTKTEKKWKEINNLDEAAIARNLTAIVYYYIGRLEISVKLYSQNLVYYKAKQNWVYYSKMLINIASVYLKKENPNKALENLLLAETFLNKFAAKDAYLNGNLYCNIGEAYYGIKKYDLALQYFFQSLKELNKINLTDNIANTQMYIGLTYLATRNYDKSINYLKLALENYKQIKFAKGVMDVQERIINYNKVLNNVEGAIRETKSLELMANEAKDTTMLAKSYEHYADLYQIQNNSSLSAEYFKKYFLLSQYLEHEENKQSFIGLQVLTAAEEKDLENLNLRQDNELQKERINVGSIILLTVAGGLVLISVFLIILYKKEKNISKYAALLEKKNEEINTQNKKLEEVILSKDKFFSILAHNLKNPFWALLSLNKMLEEDYAEFSDTEKITIITRMGNSLRNVYNLFENLLSWAKTQQSALKPFKEKLNIRQTIDNAVKPYCLRAEEKNVSLVINAESSLSFYVDRFMIETVIGNLVDNAIKFSKINGSIIISASCVKKMCTISIKDYGVGMTKEIIEKLFRIDQNISCEGTLKEKGTGLGLIICEEFIKLNNGEIKVESTIDEGSTFCIILPSV